MKPPAWIAHLTRNGAVAYSQVSRDSTHVLDQIRTLRLVDVETQGNRRRVIVREPDGFAEWVTKTYPDAVTAPVPGQRAANIARTRRSKAGLSTHAAQPLLLRWFSADPASPWANLSRRCGIVGITTDRLAVLTIPTHWTLLTVENWESFLALDYAPEVGDIIAVFTSGNIADGALRALAALSPSPVRVIHAGDYDWSGLAIYRRIRVILSQSEIYVPADIAVLFRDFASYDLLLGQPALIVRQDDSIAVRQVISLIEQHNAGLEQEIVAPPPL